MTTNNIATDAGVTVYSTGLVCCSVCAPIALELDGVEDAVNRLHPTGIDSRWRVSADPTFANGGEQPGPCDTLPESHIHYLMEC